MQVQRCAPVDVVIALAPLLELDASEELALELLADEAAEEEGDVSLDGSVLVLVLVLVVLVVGVAVVVLDADVVVVGANVVVAIGVVVVVGVAVVAKGVEVVGVGVSLALKELEELDAKLKSHPASALESHVSALAVANAAAAVSAQELRMKPMQKVWK